MTAAPLLLWIPGLCGTGPAPAGASRLCPGVRRIWPGLPSSMAAGGAPENAFVPDGLPYGPREARAYLNDVDAWIANSGSAGAGGGIAAMLADEQAESRLRGELDEVRRLGAGKKAGGASGADGRVRAQQMLLWIWKQQQCLGEIESLLGRVKELEGQISGGYGVEEKDAALELADGGFSPEMEDGTESFEPDWRICLAAAAVLCPGAVFFLEGRAAGEMQEACAFSPDPELAAQAGMPEGSEVLSFEGPAAQVLGGILQEAGAEGTVRLAVPVLPGQASGECR